MGNTKEASELTESLPEDWLLRALRADTSERRLACAKAGLARTDEAIDPETHVLLLRQQYLGQLALHDLPAARASAEAMVAVSALPEIAHHDLSRILFALGEGQPAIFAQRLAARAAPVARRSFHLFCLATLLHFEGQSDAALAALARAERWARRDLPLLRALAASIRLERGEAVPGLDRIVHELKNSACREGYGEYLLGCIGATIGDERSAVTYLRAFLHRNAGADAPKILALREELRRARDILARLASA